MGANYSLTGWSIELRIEGPASGTIFGNLDFFKFFNFTLQNRAGCGFALENYMFGCLSLIEGESKVCNSHCQHSLIALMSTHEGKRLMKVRISHHPALFGI